MSLNPDEGMGGGWDPQSPTRDNDVYDFVSGNGGRQTKLPPFLNHLGNLDLESKTSDGLFTVNGSLEQLLIKTAGLLYYHTMSRIGQTRNFEELSAFLNIIARSLTTEYEYMLVSIIRDHEESQRTAFGRVASVAKRTAASVTSLFSRDPSPPPSNIRVNSRSPAPSQKEDPRLSVYNKYSLQEITKICIENPQLILNYQRNALKRFGEIITSNYTTIQFAAPNSDGWTKPGLFNEVVTALFGLVYLHLLIADYPLTILNFLTDMSVCLGVRNRQHDDDNPPIQNFWPYFWLGNLVYELPDQVIYRCSNLTKDELFGEDNYTGSMG